MNEGTKRLAIGATVIIVALLLYRGASKLGLVAPVVSYKPPVVNVTTETYNLPGLQIPSSGGRWDWMQTTDLECGCDSGGAHFDPTRFDTPSLPTSPPSYVYVKPAPPAPQIYYYPAPPVTFEVATFPGPQWWWGWQGLSRVVFLSSGQALRAGLGNREFQLNGDDLSWHGYHYKHDASRDVGL